LISIAEIAHTVKGVVEGDPDLIVKGICDLKDSRADHISYIVSGPNEKYFYDTKAVAFLVNNDFSIDRQDKTLIRVLNPTLSFIDVIHMFYPKKKMCEEIHSTSVISDDVQIGEQVEIEPHVVIKKGAKIGGSVHIGANTYIGSNTQIGDGTVIYSNVSIYHDIKIGKNCIIDAGTSIGADGFGLVTDHEIHHKIPHIGSVRIEDNVWIGSNCCIDRGTFNDTIIEKGSKLDNLIQIAHNVKIGKNCRLSGQTAIAGSTILEDNVTLAGQVGIIDHVTIGRDSIVASKTAVYESLKPGSFVSGIPARPHKNRLRQEVIINQLPEILIRLRKLEKEFFTI